MNALLGQYRNDFSTVNDTTTSRNVLFYFHSCYFLSMLLTLAISLDSAEQTFMNFIDRMGN